MALHIIAYQGPDEDHYVQRSSKEFYNNHLHRNVIQRLIHHKKNFIFRVEKNAAHKNLFNKTSHLGKLILCKSNDNVLFYDLEEGDKRGDI